MFLYATTVTLSACLLFLVQPLIAKMILPWFGGTSSVWIATLLFFQVCLLCGYAYAHGLSKLAARRQVWIHSGLLLLSCALMPILPAESWRTQQFDNPALQILLVLTSTAGLPSLLLSASSPLIQTWYVRRYASPIPLWLFALSNFGSLAALLSFPLLFEPTFDTHTLAIVWSIAFVGFALLCIWTGWRSRAFDTAAPIESIAHSKPAALQMLLWILFAACASALLAATTVQLTTNIAPIPLLWVVPLAIYLLTFIVNFRAKPLYRRTPFFMMMVVALGCLAWLYANSETQQDIATVIPMYLGSLFVVCMGCHGEIALRAPAPAYLTRFYLLIAFGGALGGAFVTLLAPMLFDSYLELPILIFVTAELMVYAQWRRRGATLVLWPLRIAMIAGVLALAGYLFRAEEQSRAYSLNLKRDFYGVLQVREYVEAARPRRTLVNGTIRHGYQFVEPTLRLLPTSYYSQSSGVGRALLAKQKAGPMRVGVIGLGVGTLASYARSRDRYSIYEINPDVLDIAQHDFTFLQAAQDRSADVKILLGDARLTLESQAPMEFDVLAVDAFSSDAVPTHLLTNEAFALYARHLKPDGVLAIHVSNKYLNLEWVCERAAHKIQRTAKLVADGATPLSDASYWVLITSDEELWHDAEFADAQIVDIKVPDDFKGWTDRYSSVWAVLKLRSSRM
ncbi:MAG TPA: fused MFS/spermidine synthase [Steroidobacteraceae bacterium]|nr:fused MFS/spermidine synthase [Steroidobacteraceae bacterium]